MQISPDPIQSLIDAASKGAVPYLGAVAAVGTITMALIQTAKDLFPLRRLFQRGRVLEWLAEGAVDAKTKFGGDVSAGTAERDLIHLATDDDSSALYDLPIEQLCGQLNAAAQLALDYPNLHFDLLAVTASGAAAEDLQALRTPPPLPAKAGDMTPELLAAKTSYTDARNRVSHQVQRAIDALQISVGFRWKWSLQIASFVLSALIAGIADWIYGTPPRSLVNILITALLAGFLAPVARDLMAALQKART
jgi:hypothetical protein